jgi:NAD(P)-dependent dehydrogenase (short-subunit alcohol dehydrogenase family)
MTTPELFRLDGRVALVTGGAGIYGQHIVRALAETGAHVVAASRDEEHCRHFASELTARGLGVSADRCDLGDEAGLIAVRDRLLARHGRLDVLFNNAVARVRGGLREMTAADWEASMRVNATGLFLACKIFSEPMQAQRSGSIVNIASIYGMGGPDFSIYEGHGHG